MSRVEWQWRDEGSGPGHMQKVIVHEPDPDAARKGMARLVFRNWLNHAAGCRVCRTSEPHCARGRRLQAAYAEARQGPTPGT